MKNILYELSLPYFVAGKLVYEGELQGFTTKWKLLVVKDKKRFAVHNMSDLCEFVKIRNEKDVLSFARIRTNPQRLLFFSDGISPCVEVLNRNKLHYDPVFGKKEDYEIVRKYYSQEDECFSHEYKKYPIISRIGSDFKIKRLLITDKYDACDVEEVYSGNGKLLDIYLKKISRVNTKSGLLIKVSIPNHP